MTSKVQVKLSQSALLWFVYFLYLLVIPALIGVIINFINAHEFRKIFSAYDEGEEVPDVITSHHQWLLRTFIFVLAGCMAGLGTMYYGVGYVIAAGAIVWWFIRVLRGMVALAGNRSIGAPY